MGQEICSDAFAPGSIRLLPSFFSKFAEPLSEAVDALVGTDWYFHRVFTAKQSIVNYLRLPTVSSLIRQ